MQPVAASLQGWAQDALLDGGYVVLAALIALENLLPPIPSEVLLPLAGYSVSTGALAYPFAVLAATTGSVVGALVLYGLGRIGGRPLLLRHGRLLRLDEQRLDRADEWFDRHGTKLVLLGRMVPGVRSAVSVPAGLSEMPLGRFTVLTAIGSSLWNAALIGAGWALGERWEDVSSAIGRVELYALGAVVLAGLALLVVHRRRRAAAFARR